MKERVYLARPLVLALGLAVFAASPTRAADVTGEEPPVPVAPLEEAQPSGWDGAYAGVTGSYSTGLAKHSQPVPNRHVTDGFRGSVFTGYNVQDGQIVYGGEADLGYGNVKGNNAGRALKSGLDGSLRARVGVAVTPDVLLYGAGGLAAARMTATEGGVADSKTALGWTAGVGTDIKVTDQVFARGEYRFTDYGKRNFTTGSGVDAVKANENRFSLGLGVKF